MQGMLIVAPQEVIEISQPSQGHATETIKGLNTSFSKPTTLHKYVVSARVLQNTRMLFALRNSCRVELVERDYEYLRVCNMYLFVSFIYFQLVTSCSRERYTFF